FILPHLGETLRGVFQLLWEHQAALVALRLGLTFVILLIPATAMGLTLPVLLEDSSLQRHSFGHTLGLLYGWNTLGAVAGVLMGELYFIKAFGLPGAALTAGSISAAAAVIAWLVNRFDCAASRARAREEARQSRRDNAAQMAGAHNASNRELHCESAPVDAAVEIRSRETSAREGSHSRRLWRLLGCA